MSVLGYFAYAHGYDTQTGLPVDSVDPWKASARLRYGTQQGFGAQIIGTLVGAHDQVSNPTYFRRRATSPSTRPSATTSMTASR